MTSESNNHFSPQGANYFISLSLLFRCFFRLVLSLVLNLSLLILALHLLHDEMWLLSIQNHVMNLYSSDLAASFVVSCVLHLICKEGNHDNNNVVTRDMLLGQALWIIDSEVCRNIDNTWFRLCLHINFRLIAYACCLQPSNKIKLHQLL